MISVRIEPELVVGLREVASARGVKVSELLREAASNLVAEYQRQEFSFQIWTNQGKPQIFPRISVTSGDGVASAYGATINIKDYA